MKRIEMETTEMKEKSIILQRIPNHSKIQSCTDCPSY